MKEGVHSVPWPVKCRGEMSEITVDVISVGQALLGRTNCYLRGKAI